MRLSVLACITPSPIEHFALLRPSEQKAAFLGSTHDTNQDNTYHDDLKLAKMAQRIVLV